MKLSVLLAITAALGASAQPLSSGSSSNRTIRAPAGRIVGTLIDNVEYYRGIPYAKPPSGPLRLRAPVRLPPSCNLIDATGIGPACPQMMNIEQPPLFNQALMTPGAADALFLGNPQSEGVEDCLTLSVARPADAPADARLPVLYWIHGGGFELGSSQGYNASNLIPRSVEQEKPFILVTVNYRLGGFGFLGGAEVLADGITNLGLRDQRMGLEWVADNIAAFGGNPDAVTIIGESAGAFSVFSQMALNDGNNTYNGEPLFRAAIMHSGSTASNEPVDGPLAQGVFDSVVEAAECSGADDKIECLRSADYEKFWTATMSVPSFLSNSSIALSYVPRADQDVLTASTDVLAKQGNFAKVPLIIGDTADEGTIFAVFASDLSTEEELVTYLQDYIYKNASPEELTTFVNTYDTAPTAIDGAYLEFDRLAEVLGDAFFTLKRREFLQDVAESVQTWSFLGSWTDFPILGAFHTSDLPHLFYGTGAASRAMQDRYIAFINSLDPNDGIDGLPMEYQTQWPQWRDSHKLLNFGGESTDIISDDFRQDSFEFIKSHADALLL